MITKKDMEFLKRSVELAKEALEKGDQPFGSVLVSENGEILFEDHNRISGGDQTQHPEFAIARWAAENMTEEERKKSTVYTSGEHCPMCSAAHGMVGLGRIVYVSSSEQLVQWKKELGAPDSKIYNISIENVIRNANVEGPVVELSEEIKKLHIQYYEKNK